MRQESHRVYWQQRGVAAATATTLPGEPRERLVTSSAAIRISEAARAKDVTELLRQTLSLPYPVNASEQDFDFLVLVGTLRHADVVRFEHEPPKGKNSAAEPFHIVRSLVPQESPLVVRDQLVEFIESRYPSTGTKSYQLQWFFVPGTEPSGSIPNCVQLDGYCTSMEDEDDDGDECDSESEQEECSDELEKSKQDTPWWRIDSTRKMSRRLPHHLSEQSTSSFEETIRIARERRRLAQLSSCRSALDHHCVSGYLLKRSSHDVHVWKRVHCVLTDDHLWYVSRIKDSSSIARHGRIGLIRAMLIEPDSSPHYRIPFCFELVSANGTPNLFRAPNRSIQMRWVACLRERIVQCHDNRSMEHAELIVEDETVARNKRLTQVALPQNFLERVLNKSSDPKNMKNVGRFGLEVARYRESCRHIQGVLPSKTAVVAASSNSSRAQPQELLPNQNDPSPKNELPSPKRVLDSDTRDMVRSAWDEAAGLLGVATQLALALPGGAQDGSKRMARSVETSVRHVDYVITGRFRPLDESGLFSEGSSSNARPDVYLDDPPPADLFDHLLRELQTLASSADHKTKTHDARMNGKANGEARKG